MNTGCCIINSPVFRDLSHVIRTIDITATLGNLKYPTWCMQPSLYFLYINTILHRSLWLSLSPVDIPFHCCWFWFWNCLLLHQSSLCHICYTICNIWRLFVSYQSHICWRFSIWWRCNRNIWITTFTLWFFTLIYILFTFYYPYAQASISVLKTLTSLLATIMHVLGKSCV